MERNLKHVNMVEEWLSGHGFSPREEDWREGPDGPEYLLGRFRVIEDQEMVFEGDEGELTVSVVGAAIHGNERVYVGFMAEGTDCPEEVAMDALEQID